MSITQPERRLLRLLLVVTFAAAGVLLLAPSAGAADVDIFGDWNVTGTEAYADQTVQVHATAPTNWTDGNLTVQPGGSLTLTNCTLVLPWGSILYVGGTLVADNTTVDGPAWFFWMNGTTTLTNAHVVNATYSMNSTYKEVWVESMSTTFDRVTWTDANGNGSRIWMNVPLDFQGQVLEGGSGIHYMVDGSFAGAAIDVSQNRFYNSSTVARYGVAVDGPAIPQPLSFDIHHNTFNGTLVGVGLLRVDDNTSYEVHDMDVNGTGFTTGIMPGVQGSGTRFKGHLNISDYTVLNAYVGVWMWGAAPYDMVIHINRMTAINVSYVLSIGGGFADVYDSTFTATRTWIYEGLTQGHIRVHETADTAFFATLPGTNATVEHLVWLPLTGATWQGAVPFTGQVVSLFNETGVLNLTVDPQTWTPHYAVQWGVYPGSVRVDNRDLRPAVVDGANAFACTPTQFYLTDGMPPFTIECTDDRPPVVSVSGPPADSYLNQSSFTVVGNLSETGSGIATFGISLDNVSFQPVAPGANGSTAWSAALGPLADGAYSITVRAVDRTGNVAYDTVFPVRIDTVFPVLVMGDSDWGSGTQYNISGSSEPFAQLTVRRSYGWNQTVALPADGQFTVTVPIDEGQNVFAVRVQDRAGNAVERSFVVRVDTLAPAVTAMLDGMPAAALWTGNASVHVSGACEANATVDVEGVAAQRTGASFDADVPLVAGRNDLDVVCTDEAGNRGHWYGFAFYDAVAPDLAARVDGAVELSPGHYLVTSPLAAIAGRVVDNGSGIAAVSVAGNPAVLSGSGVLTVSIETPEGETTVDVMAVDRVGNTATVRLTILRDSVAPEATFTWVEAGSPIVEVGGVPTTAGSQVGLHILLTEAATVAFAGRTLDLPAGESTEVVALADGANRFTVSVHDAAGNGPPDETLQVNRDTTPPEITLFEPQGGTTMDVGSVEVKGQVEPGSAVTVNGNPVALSATGDFHVLVDLVLGANTVTVVAKDALGNAANMSVSVEWKVPTEPEPTAPAGNLEIPLLLVGLVAGVGVGALAMRGRSGAARRAEAEAPAAPEAAEEGSPFPPPGREASKGPKGPKGPRGPAPPPE